MAVDTSLSGYVMNMTTKSIEYVQSQLSSSNSPIYTELMPSIYMDICSKKFEIRDRNIELVTKMMHMQFFKLIESGLYPLHDNTLSESQRNQCVKNMTDCYANMAALLLAYRKLVFNDEVELKYLMHIVYEYRIERILEPYARNRIKFNGVRYTSAAAKKAAITKLKKNYLQMLNFAPDRDFFIMILSNFDKRSIK